jgi:hypothetical protein
MKLSLLLKNKLLTVYATNDLKVLEVQVIYRLLMVLYYRINMDEAAHENAQRHRQLSVTVCISG